MKDRKEDILYSLDTIENQAEQAADDAETAYDMADNAAYEAQKLSDRIESIKQGVKRLDDREVPDELIGLLQDIQSAMSLVSEEIQEREGEEIGETVLDLTDSLDNSCERIENWMEENYYEN